MATPKPRPGYNNPGALMTPKPNPSLHRPSIIIPAVPTVFSYTTQHHPKPVKPTSLTLPSFIPQSNRHAGPEVSQETRWPIRGNLFSNAYYYFFLHNIILAFDIVLIIFSHCQQQAKLSLSIPLLSPLLLG